MARICPATCVPGTDAACHGCPADYSVADYGVADYGPADYGAAATICNRFNRWSHRGLWTRRFATSARAERPDDLSIDSTAVRALRPVPGEKAGHGGVEGIKFPRKRCRHLGAPRSARQDAPAGPPPGCQGLRTNSLRARLAASKTAAVIPSARSRKTPFPDDAVAYID